MFENDDLRLDVKHKMLKGNNGYMQLSQRETELLAHLIRSDGVVISRGCIKKRTLGQRRKLQITLLIGKYLRFARQLKLFRQKWFCSLFMDEESS